MIMQQTHTRGLAGWGFLFALCGATMVAAAPEGPPASQPSAADSRLQRTVRNSQIGGSLSDYLELVTGSSKVEHRVAAPFGERPMLALGIAMSLARVHRLLARNSQLTWAASPEESPTYTLTESRADRAARAGALAAMRLQGRRRLAARFDRIRRMSFLNAEELADLKDSEPEMVHCLQHPRSSAVARLAFGLPKAVWSEFWKSGTARVTVASLPANLQKLATDSAGSGMAGPQGGEKYRIADLVVPQGQLKLQVGGSLDRPTIWCGLRYGNHGMLKNLLYAEAAVRQPPEERRKTAGKNPSKVPDDPRLRQKVTLKDRPRQKKAIVERGERPEGSRPLAEYLQQLWEQTDLPAIAECDYKPRDLNWLRGQWWLAADTVQRPLAEALDLLCADFEFEWQFREGTLLLRPKRWFAPLDEQGSIPFKEDRPAKSGPGDP